MSKKSDRTESLVTLGLAVAIVLVVTINGLFIPQACHAIDKQYLYCNLHPASGWAVFGLILMWAGGLCVCGVTNVLGFRLMGQENSIGKWPFIFLAATVVGAALAWFA